MIKRKDGRWFIEGREGDFTTLDEARSAEQLLPPVVAKPVQHLNTSSGVSEVKTSYRKGTK